MSDLRKVDEFDAVTVPDLAPSLMSLLDDAEERGRAADALTQEFDSAKEKIKDAFRDRVVVFVDLVGSTAYKVEKADDPFVWAQRVKKFSSLTKRFLEDANGSVVKYIGDEVMGIFSRGTMVHDAVSFLQRISLLEATVFRATKVETRVKVAVDTGSVALFEYEGHEALDPQGLPVDRCARIGKFAKAGLILASKDFVNLCADRDVRGLYWKQIGTVSFKGLGDGHAIYNLGETDEKVEDMKDDLRLSDWIALQEELALLRIHTQQLTSQVESALSTNESLVTELKSQGVTVESTKVLASAPLPPDEKAWLEIEQLMKEFTDKLEESGAPTSDHAYFLWRSFRGEGHRVNLGEDNFQKMQDFDYVLNEEGNYLELDIRQTFNKDLLGTASELGTALSHFSMRFPKFRGYKFELSLGNALFWSDVLGISVA